MPPNLSLAMLKEMEMNSSTSRKNTITTNGQLGKREKYRGSSSCSIREENISTQSIRHHTMLKEIGIACSSVILGTN